MRKSGGNATKFGGIDPQLCVQEWRRRYPYKTANYVAARYGAPLRTVENWLSLASLPSFQWLGRILEIEDAGFMVAVMPSPPDYLREAAIQQQCREAEDSMARAREALGRLRVAS